METEDWLVPDSFIVYELPPNYIVAIAAPVPFDVTEKFGTEVFAFSFIGYVCPPNVMVAIWLPVPVVDTEKLGIEVLALSFSFIG